MSRRMFKKAVQLGRSERRCEACASVRCASARSENVAVGHFQHSARKVSKAYAGGRPHKPRSSALFAEGSVHMPVRT